MDKVYRLLRNLTNTLTEFGVKKINPKLVIYAALRITKNGRRFNKSVCHPQVFFHSFPG